MSSLFREDYRYLIKETKLDGSLIGFSTVWYNVLLFLNQLPILSSIETTEVL